MPLMRQKSSPIRGCGCKKGKNSITPSEHITMLHSSTGTACAAVPTAFLFCISLYNWCSEWFISV